MIVVQDTRLFRFLYSSLPQALAYKADNHLLNIYTQVQLETAMPYLMKSPIPSSIQRIKLGAEKYLVNNDISPWTQPARWLDCNKDDVLKVAHNSAYFEYIAQTRIYLRLTWLICSNNQLSAADLERLQLNLSKWNALSAVDILVKSREIQQELISNIKSLRISPRTSEYQQAFELDLIALWVYVLLTLSSETEMHDILSRKDQDAQSLLDLFQSLLNCYDLGGPSRDRIVGVFMGLSQATGLYPENIKYATLGKVQTMPSHGRIAYVFKAEICGKTYAIKLTQRPSVLKAEQCIKVEKVILKETLLLRQLSHANLCCILGVVKLHSRTAIILPWMMHGTVRWYLKNNPPSSYLALIHDISLGLEYLHSMGVVHGDLRLSNVFVNDEGRAQLSDFGLAVAAKDIICAATPLIGMSVERYRPYTAPEVMFNHAVSREGDMWSFASTLYEIFTSHQPFYTIKGILPYYIKAKSGELPPIPDKGSMRTAGAEEEIWTLMCKCWSVGPQDRPTASNAEILLAYKSGRKALSNLGHDI